MIYFKKGTKRAVFLRKLFCNIAKWTFLKCPKSKIEKKFGRKKAKKTSCDHDVGIFYFIKNNFVTEIFF